MQFEGQTPLYKPTEQESGKTYIPGGQVAQIAKLAGWDGKTPVTADFSHALMLAYNEAQPKDEPSHIDTSGKFLDKDGNPVPVMIGDKTGRVRLLDLSGVKNASAQPSAQPSTPGAANGGPFDTSGAQTAPAPPAAAQGTGASPFTFAPKEPADKSLHFEKDTDDEGNVTTRAFDAATAELVSRRTEKIGPKRKDPDAPAAPKPMSAALKVQIAKTKATALAKAETEYKKALSTAITPQDREDAAAERQASWRAAQDEYEQSISTATGQDVPHNPWADGGPVQTPPPAAAKTAAPAAGKPKTAKLSDVRAYAKKNGISEADALKKAKSERLRHNGAVMPQSFTDFMAAPSASPAQSFGEFMAAPAPVAAPAPGGGLPDPDTVLRETDINAHALAGIVLAQHAAGAGSASVLRQFLPCHWGLRTPQEFPAVRAASGPARAVRGHVAVAGGP